MSVNVSGRSRKPKGSREGGQFAPEIHSAPSMDLDAGVDDIIQTRREAYLRDGWVSSTSLPAPAPPKTTSRITAWWGRAFSAYGANKNHPTIPVLPDNWSRAHREGKASKGCSVEGHRRVSRMRYQVAGRDIRMPSRTAINHYMRHVDTSQLQVPISIDTPTGPKLGFVTLTRHPDGSWVGQAGGGFTGEDKLYVEEACAAVMERGNMEFGTPQALRARARARNQARGIQSEPVVSSWIQEWGWDKQHNIMYMATRDGNTYGYQMPEGFSPPEAAYRKPGEWFNKNIRGKIGQTEAEQCPNCGCFLPDLAEHVCRVEEKTVLKHTHAADIYNQCASGDYPVFDHGTPETTPENPAPKPNTTGLAVTSLAVRAGGRPERAPWAYRDGRNNGDNGQLHYDGVKPGSIELEDYSQMDEASRKIFDAVRNRDDVEFAGTVYKQGEHNQIRALRIYGKTLKDGYVAAFNQAEQAGIEPGRIARVTESSTPWGGQCLCYTLVTASPILQEESKTA